MDPISAVTGVVGVLTAGPLAPLILPAIGLGGLALTKYKEKKEREREARKATEGRPTQEEIRNAIMDDDYSRLSELSYRYQQRLREQKRVP